jgi:hypothetical protein
LSTREVATLISVFKNWVLSADNGSEIVMVDPVRHHKHPRRRRRRRRRITGIGNM